ncbi:hypothetical protein [Sorangium sp. So ce1335]|uniref:hypothetical protein n=1 Tax=Sorangium sp. So ce1335 TaxID=3133335 RepID=UPI003F62E3FB
MLFEKIRSRTGMCLREETYAAASAFVLGYDLAAHGGVLNGFREWLIVRLDTGNNLAWTALVLRAAFPGNPDPQAAHRSSVATQRHAIDVLFQLIAEFDDYRAKPDGLRKIYFEYERWLRKQEWYVTGSPGWLE